MKKYKHSTHTAYEFRHWKPGKKGIVFISEKGNKKNFKCLMHNWKFYVSIPNKYQWFALIRTPFFMFEKNNCGFTIGHPNHFFWVIS